MVFQWSSKACMHYNAQHLCVLANNIETRTGPRNPRTMGTPLSCYCSHANRVLGSIFVASHWPFCTIRWNTPSIAVLIAELHILRASWLREMLSNSYFNIFTLATIIHAFAAMLLYFLIFAQYGVNYKCHGFLQFRFLYSSWRIISVCYSRTACRDTYVKRRMIQASKLQSEERTIHASVRDRYLIEEEYWFTKASLNALKLVEKSITHFKQL